MTTKYFMIHQAIEGPSYFEIVTEFGTMSDTDVYRLQHRFGFLYPNNRLEFAVNLKNIVESEKIKTY